MDENQLDRNELKIRLSILAFLFVVLVVFLVLAIVFGDSGWTVLTPALGIVLSAGLMFSAYRRYQRLGQAR